MVLLFCSFVYKCICFVVFVLLWG